MWVGKRERGGLSLLLVGLVRIKSPKSFVLNPCSLTFWTGFLFLQEEVPKFCDYSKDVAIHMTFIKHKL